MRFRLFVALKSNGFYNYTFAACGRERKPAKVNGLAFLSTAVRRSRAGNQARFGTRRSQH